MKRPAHSLRPRGNRSNFRLSPGFAACLLASALPACDRAPHNAPEVGIAARVGDEIIAVKDVEDEIAWRIERGAMVGAPEAVLSEMIERRILVNKAIAAGMDRDPNVRRARENLLIARYKDEYLRKTEREADVSDGEIEKQYAAHPESYRNPARARLAILRSGLPVSAPADEREAAVARMREAVELSARPADGPGFGSIAVRYSDDDVTRNRGGDAGWLHEGVAYRWPEEVVRTGFALAPGETAGPIDTGDAVYVVRKLDERPATTIPLEQVRDKLRREILSERLKEIESTFAARIRDGLEIETFPESLAEIRVPDPSAGDLVAGESPPGIP